MATFRQAHISGDVADFSIKREFSAEQAALLRRFAAVLFPALIGVQIVWFAQDLVVSRRDIWHFAGARSLALVAFAAVLVYVWLPNKTPRQVNWAAYWGVVVIQASSVWFLFRIESNFAGYLFGAMIAMYVCALCLPWPWYFSPAVAAATAVFFAVGNFRYGFPLSEQNIACFLFGFPLGTLICVHTHWVRYRGSFREFQQRAAAERSTAAAQEQRDENARSLRELHQSVRQDSLTGIPNRRALEEFLDRNFINAAHESHSLGFILCDLDHFKRINDTYGHDTGDKVLVAVAKTLASRARPQDLVARYGGEEFAVVVVDASRDQLAELAEHIRSGIDTEIPNIELGLDPEVLLTLSAGVSIFPDSASSVDELMTAADRALYEAKASGRNCSVFSQALPVMHRATFRTPREDIDVLDDTLLNMHDMPRPSIGQIKSEFQKKVGRSIKRLAVPASAIGLFAHIWAASTDYSVAPNHFELFLPIRIFVCSILIVSVITLAATPAKPTLATPVAVFACWAVEFESGWQATVAGESFDSYFTGYLMSIPTVAMLFPWHWATSIWITGMSLLGLVVTHIYGDPLSENMVQAIVFYTLMAAAVTIAGHYLKYRSSWREFKSRSAALVARAALERENKISLVIKEKLEHLNSHDSLTLLANRRSLDIALESAIRAARHNHTNVGFILMDIDHFKRVNDDFGHQVGDEVLREIARHLSSHAAAVTSVARYGGEEFGIIVENADFEEFAELAERIRATVWQPQPDCSLARIVSLDTLGTITLSAGYSMFPRDASNATEIRVTADAALYEAKNTGRQRSIAYRDCAGRRTTAAS